MSKLVAATLSLMLIAACSREQSGAGSDAASTAGTTTSSSSPSSGTPSATTSAPVAPAATDASKLLTVPDVEKVSGEKGVQLVPQNPSKGAGGDLNFADGSGKLLVMMSYQPASTFAAWKRMAPNSLSGVGDEAASGPSADDPYVLIFRKGDHAVSLSSFLDEDMKPRLSLDKLKQLGEIAIGRM